MSDQDAQVVTDAGLVVADLPLLVAGTHRLSATVTRTRTMFSVDGVRVGSVPTLATSAAATTYGGFGLTAGRPSTSASFPTFSTLKVTPA